MRPAALLVLLFALLPALSAHAAEETLSVMSTGGLRGETAALLLSGQEGGALPLAVLALPFPGPPGQARVSVVVEVAGPALLAGQTEGPPTPLTPLDVEICLYALGPRGGIVATLLDTVEIAPEGFAGLKRSGLAFQGELLLPPGETSLRVLVRNPETGAMGLRRITLAVPAFQEGATILSPPLFASPAAAWTLARAAEGVTPVPGTGDSGLPAARPVLLPGAEMTFQALAYRLGPEARLTALLRRRSGEQSAVELPLRLAGRAGAGAPDLEALTLVLAVGKIEPGAYELRLAAGPVVSPALPVILSPGSAGRTWPAVALPAVATASPEPVVAGVAGERPKAAPARHHRFAAAPLQAAYLAALRPLAGGDEAAARSAVAAFEAEQLGSGASREALTSEDLIEVEAPVAGDLSRRDPEALVALLLLYERLYHQALEHRAYRLATHDGEVLFGLAELYAKQSHAAGAREIAAAFLAGLGQGPEPGLSPLARHALERSLTYDPGNEAALLGLAADAGWRGDVRAAALALERLLKRHPESPEGRLRLALARARLGDPARARQLLGALLAADPAHPGTPADPEPWLLSLAYQELARLQLAAGEAEPAARTVEAGLARLPGDGALQLEQAFLLDCRGEHGRAREVLAGLEVHPDEGGTPRHRYNQPPAAAFDRSEKALEARAAERQGAFAAAAAGVHREAARP